MQAHTRPSVEPSDLAPSTAAQRELIPDTFNDAAVSYPANRSIHDLFQLQAQQKPDAFAIIFDQQQITYADLNRRANRLAYLLIGLGVRVDDRVGLLVERSPDAVVGMLAILKAGGAYVPLDPNYPAARLAFMREDSSLVAVLTTSNLMGLLNDFRKPIVPLDAYPGQRDDDPQVVGQTSESLAYVIYTSGSTGRPKGVMVEHRNVVNLVINNHFAAVSSRDCIAHCASPSFDATTWEVWAALLNGARLLIIPQAIVFDPRAFNRVLVHHSVTAMFLTVGLFNEYVDALEEALGRLKYLLVGGDALVPSIIATALSKSTRPQFLINAYGPTETTTFATTFRIEGIRDTATGIPIGKPISNGHAYILDDERRPVPVGGIGEIYIGGGGVARGYLNQAQLTDERFVTDPFGSTPGSKLYRTGDLGRYRPDGNIEFLGRTDSQVKIRGFRVELGEVETVLQQFPGVKQAVAVAREDEPGIKRLICYVVPTVKDQSAQHLVQQLREHAQSVLPPHMVPAIIASIDNLPLTPNGKVDRCALPAPDTLEQLTQEYAAPLTPTEEILCTIWARSLKVERVGIHDNFFELGGDSLLGIEMSGQVAEVLQTELPFMAVFQYPTVHDLAVLVDELAAGRAG